MSSQKEDWKKIKFEFKYTNNATFKVSNLGNVSTTNTIAKNRALKGSNTNGYKIVRLKLFKPRAEQDQKKIDLNTKKISQLIKKSNQEGIAKKELKVFQQELATLKKENSLFIQSNLKERTIHHHFLVHRIVAEYFVKKPSKKHVFVTHLDFNKLNNEASNLQWMTQEELTAHNKKNPTVIKSKKQREYLVTNSKLNEKKVIEIKKLLQDNTKTIKEIASKYNITDMQIYRIKTGENWSRVSL